MFPLQNSALQKFFEFKRKASQTSVLTSSEIEKILEKNREEIKIKLDSKPIPIKLEPPKLEIKEEDDENAPLFAPELPKREHFEECHNTIALELFTRDDLLIKTSMFASGTLRDAIQKSAGIYCKESNGWVIPLKMYQEFRKNIRNLKGLTIQELPEFVVKGLADSRPLSTKRCPHDYSCEPIKRVGELPESLIEKLYPFQQEGVQFALQHYGRVLIGDEMGVGKTIQGVAIAAAYRDEWPVLVVCPASIKLNWRDEFMKWIPDLERKDFYLLHSKRTMKNSAIVWIASYTMATHLETFLNSKYFNVVIADESHYLKNYNAKRTKCLLPFLQKAKRVILLSGTPVMSRPAELFTQLSCIRPDIFYSFRVFAERYCDPKILFTHTDYSGASNIKELHTLLSNTVMIRRLKSDVLQQLPAKLRQKVEIPVVNEHCRSIRKLYYEVKRKKNYFREVNQDVCGLEAEAAAKKMESDMFMSRAYSLTAKAKMKGVCEYVSYLIQSDCKFIIFGHHIDMLDMIEEQTIREKVKYIRIDGSTSQEHRYKGVEAFQTMSDCRVAILGILAAGQGITLTAASTVVMAEMSWTPGVMIQAEDRAHRIGQEKSVNIHYLFGPGTLDEYIWPKIQHKLSVISGALDNNKNTALDSLINPENRLGMGDFDAFIDSEIPEDLFQDEIGEKRTHGDIESEEEEEENNAKCDIEEFEE